MSDTIREELLGAKAELAKLVSGSATQPSEVFTAYRYLDAALSLLPSAPEHIPDIGKMVQLLLRAKNALTGQGHRPFGEQGHELNCALCSAAEMVDQAIFCATNPAQPLPTAAPEATVKDSLTVQADRPTSCYHCDGGSCHGCPANLGHSPEAAHPAPAPSGEDAQIVLDYLKTWGCPDGARGWTYQVEAYEKAKAALTRLAALSSLRDQLAAERERCRHTEQRANIAEAEEGRVKRILASVGTSVTAWQTLEARAEKAESDAKALRAEKDAAIDAYNRRTVEAQALREALESVTIEHKEDGTWLSLGVGGLHATINLGFRARGRADFGVIGRTIEAWVALRSKALATTKQPDEQGGEE